MPVMHLNWGNRIKLQQITNRLRGMEWEKKKNEINMNEITIKEVKNVFSTTI